MIPLEPRLWPVVALLVANAAVSYWLFRLLRQRQADATGDPVATGEVECRSCGTPNDTDYRYCRVCVDELPGALASGAPGESVGRLTD